MILRDEHEVGGQEDVQDRDCQPKRERQRDLKPQAHLPAPEPGQPKRAAAQRDRAGHQQIARQLDHVLAAHTQPADRQQQRNAKRDQHAETKWRQRAAQRNCILHTFIL